MSVYEGHGVTLHHGDCLDVLRSLPDCSVDSVVTDPPYALGFMGREWDTFGMDVGRGAQARSQRRAEVTPTGEGHSTSAGPYLASGVDSPDRGRVGPVRARRGGRMTAPKCVGCPFRRDCPDCPWTGEIPAAATESAPVSGVACETMGARKTAPAGNRGLVPPKPLSLTEGRAAMIGAQTPTRTPIEPTRPGVANA